MTESKNESGRNAHIILRVVSELGANVIYLNQPHPDVPSSFDVDPSAEGHAESILAQIRRWASERSTRSTYWRFRGLAVDGPKKRMYVGVDFGQGECKSRAVELGKTRDIIANSAEFVRTDAVVFAVVRLNSPGPQQMDVSAALPPV